MYLSGGFRQTSKGWLYFRRSEGVRSKRGAGSRGSLAATDSIVCPSPYGCAVAHIQHERMVSLMNITDVRVRKVSDEGKMKAVVSITFDDAFVVHDIKVIEGQSGLFIAMPSRKMGEGDFRDIAHPLNSEMRNRIKEAIFEEYNKVIAEKAE